MIRVIHLNPTKTWRGGEQQTLYLAKYLQKKHVLQWVVGSPNSILQNQCRIHQIPYKAIRIFGEVDVFSAYQLAKLIIDNQISILHCHTAKAHSIGLLAKKIVKRKKKKLILVVSRRVDFSLKKVNFQLWNFFSKVKYFSKDIDAYIAISQNVKRILQNDGIPEEKIFVIYSGIDLNRFKKNTKDSIIKLRKEFGIQNEIVFGNVAALVDHKDHKTLLQSIALLKQYQGLPDWKLIIVGDGPLFKELLNLAKKLDIFDKLVFAGFRKDVFDFYYIFDVFVISSKEEGLGTSLLDAMAFGLPIIATSGGGIPEIVIHNSGGLLSPVQDPYRLAENCAYFLQHPQLKKKFSQFNRNHVKQFSYENTGKKTLELYHHLLKFYD